MANGGSAEVLKSVKNLLKQTGDYVLGFNDALFSGSLSGKEAKSVTEELDVFAKTYGTMFTDLGRKQREIQTSIARIRKEQAGYAEKALPQAGQPLKGTESGYAKLTGEAGKLLQSQEEELKTIGGLYSQAKAMMQTVVKAKVQANRYNPKEPLPSTFAVTEQQTKAYHDNFDKTRKEMDPVIKDLKKDLKKMGKY